MDKGAGKKAPFQQWFTWCQTCRHGGHARCINNWFEHQHECPVSDCDCNCNMHDSMAHHSRPATVLALPESQANSTA